MDWTTEIGASILISAVFLAIFGGAELMRGFGIGSPELTRKTVHLFAGLVALSFAYVFHSPWTLLVMCSLFVVLVLTLKRVGMLGSVHSVGRKSWGDILHPMAIYVTFIITWWMEKPDFYVIAIMVLSVSDTLAALIGKSYGFKLYAVEEESKSIEGSLIFFLSTFLIVHLCLLLLTDVGRVESVLIGLLIGIMVTCFEAVSLGGADNLFIPVGTLFLLSRLSLQSADYLAFRVFLLAFCFVSTHILSMFTRKLGSSGVIGLALAGYSSWILVHSTWYMPILFSTLLLSFSDLFLIQPGHEGELQRIRPIFYTFILSFCWVLAANRSPVREHILFIPYLVSILGSLSIRWAWYVQLRPSLPPSLLPDFVSGGGALIRASALTGLFLPYHLLIDPQLAPWFSVAACLGGILLADGLYWQIGSRFQGKWTKIAFLRMGLAVNAFSSVAVLLASLWYYRPG